MSNSKSENVLKALAKIIKDRREKAGISQTELAERAKLHRTYISNIERGTQNVSIEILCRIAEALGTSISDLIVSAEELTKRSVKPLSILLVEDNPADVFLFKRCLERAEFPTDVTTLKNGQQASEFIESIENDGSANAPELIFLDLNLPGKSGHDILKQLKSTDRFKRIPVIVLTTSSNPQDIDRTYAQFANSYLTKPVDPREFEESVGRVLQYWFETTVLPTRNK